MPGAATDAGETTAVAFAGTPTAVTRPFLVDDPARSWRVLAGRVEVFSIPLKAGVDGGPRRYLLSAEPGELIRGCDPPAEVANPVTLLAVPVGGTTVEAFPTARLAEHLASPDDRAAALRLVERYTARVAEALGENAPPRIQATLEPGESAELKAGHTATVAHEDHVWMEVVSGRVRVGDLAPRLLRPGAGLFPLAWGIWVKADEDSVIRGLSSSDAAEAGDPAAAVGALTDLLVREAGERARLDEEAELDRYAARVAEERQARLGGLRELAGILGEVPADAALPPAGGDALLATLRLIGREAGLDFHEAPAWERESNVSDPLQAICRASRIRTRQIGLRGTWWEGDSGHLLGFTKEARAPVALLRQHGGGYEAVSVTDGTRRTVTPEVAATLETMGFTFYHPFPDRPLSGMDVARIAFDSIRGEVGTLLSLALVTALLGLIVPWATNRMLSDVVPVSNEGAALTLMFALIALQVGITGFDAAKAFVLVRIEGVSNARLQEGMVDRLMSLPVAFFRRFTVGDLASRASAVNAVRDLMSGAAATSLLSGVFAVVFLFQLAWFSWRLSLVAVGVMLVALGTTAYFVSKSVKRQRAEQEVAGRLSGFTVQLIGAIPKIRVAAAEDRAFAQWAQRFREQKEIAWKASVNDNALQVFNTVLPLLASLALFTYAGWMTLEAREYALTPATFVAFNAAFGIFFGSVVSLSNTLVVALVAIPMLERAQPILQAAPETSGDRTDPGELTGRIEMSRVTFRYQEDGPTILGDVSFRAEPGEFIAFVGPSGSGKSTCLRMLLGFETPEAGAVYYDGQDLESLDLGAVRSQVGVVLQTSKLSQGNIYDNIVGSSPLTLDDAWEAADAAGLAPDIEAMPMQMHTVVAEGGSTLSGGQRQRLLIARALARKPRIIFFDEATSALDNRTQETVSRSLEETNATRVVIAHRLSTVRNADRIYVMKDGKVLQEGSFAELQEQEGLFRELVARQLA